MTIFLTQLIQVYLFCSIVQYCSSSPTNSGGGNTDNTVIDCTRPLEQTSFDSLVAGLQVLQKYSIYVNKETNVNLLLSTLYPASGCSVPVEYQYAITTGLIPDTNNIANWYTVFASLTQYLEILQTDDTANANLDTLIAVFNAIDEEFFEVLQDLHCNCSSNCTIGSPYYKPMSPSCPDQIVYLNYYFSYIIIPNTIQTVNQVCDKCTWSADSTLTWVNEHFPKDYPILFEVLKN